MVPKSAQMDVDNSPPKVSKRKAGKGDSDDENEGGDVEMLDVEFDFFDPQPHDYHSIKLLLSQLLSHDAKDLDLGAVADLVLEQKLVGSTVKCDGNEGDPYAVLTVLNLNVHKDKAPIASLIKYLLSKLSSKATDFHAALTSLLAVPAASPEDSTPAEPKHIGLVLSERLVNMPPQVVPPMYRMLQEELEWARNDKEPYHFSHLLFLSRVFLASSSDFEEDPNAALNEAENSGVKKTGKKAKKAHTGSAEKAKEEVWLYHPEDEFIARSAAHSHTFAYSNTPQKGEDKSADSFGVETRGQMMLVPMTEFGKVVEGMEGFLGGLE